LKCCHCHPHCQYHTSRQVWGNHMDTTADPGKMKLDICAVAAAPFVRCTRIGWLKVNTVTLYEINKALGTNDLQEHPLKMSLPRNTISLYHYSAMLSQKLHHRTNPMIIKLGYRRASHRWMHLIAAFFGNCYKF
jgi:hypothetical protein